MTKYYTPIIEEFSIGFVYEMEEYGLNGYTILTLDEKTSLEFINDHSDEIKVKYLDVEDLESLGFKQYKVPWQFRNAHYKLHTATHSKSQDIPQKNIRIFDSRDSHCYFDGIVKNKFELKRVLKMIGVLKND